MFWIERLVVSVLAGNVIVTGEIDASESVPSALMTYAPTTAAPLARPATSRYLPVGSTVRADGATSCTSALVLISVPTPVLLLRATPKTPIPATPAYRTALFGVTARELIPAVPNWYGEPESAASAPVVDTE